MHKRAHHTVVFRAEFLQKVDRLVGYVEHEKFAVLFHVEDDAGVFQLFDVVERLRVVFQVFELNLEVVVVFLVLFAQVDGLLVVARLTQHFDGRVQVELDVLLHEERVEARLVLQLRVAVDQQRRVVLVCILELVQLLQIVSQVDYALGVQELFFFLPSVR